MHRASVSVLICVRAATLLSVGSANFLESFFLSFYVSLWFSGVLTFYHPSMHLVYWPVHVCVVMVGGGPGGVYLCFMPLFCQPKSAQAAGWLTITTGRAAQPGTQNVPSIFLPYDPRQFKKANCQALFVACTVDRKRNCSKFLTCSALGLKDMMGSAQRAWRENFLPIWKKNVSLNCLPNCPVSQHGVRSHHWLVRHFLCVCVCVYVA